MTDKFGIVILAAGQGTRMKQSVAKPLVPLQGRRLVDYPLTEAFRFLQENKLSGKICLVTGHHHEHVESYIHEKYVDKKLHMVFQKEQKGTADALKTYLQDCPWAKDVEYTLVLCADTPLLSSWVFESLLKELILLKKDGVAATFYQENPTGYGRVVRAKKQSGFRIIEEKDAVGELSEIKKVQEVNSGVYLLKTQFILDHLYKVDNINKAGEFYLTDLFQDELSVAPLYFSDPLSARLFLGINDLLQLEQAGSYLKRRKMHELREFGVRFMDSSHTYIDQTVSVGEGSLIYPNVIIEGDSIIGKNVVIEAGAIIKKCIIGDGAVIKAYCHLEESEVCTNAQIGPYARLRTGSHIGDDAKIGNFVETKKAILHKGAKVSHLSYVGDAEIGENSNLGCGFITCNYDGANKHKTIIGRDTFIGSDSQMIAPVNIGNDCYVASGSTINQDMEDGAFAIARARQLTKSGMAKKFLKSKK